ncbi:hypothetical protein KFK09_014687 [Dendrobium nobile]|uniref:Uncharacterized protein n=1 Tax=Dendrobium nobile TaxID=94219 RepID=A0A8T3B8N9_DENNO|nr:hypothetical protein KFK09_014687 [Dendrobium nobile]
MLVRTLKGSLFRLLPPSLLRNRLGGSRVKSPSPSRSMMTLPNIAVWNIRGINRPDKVLCCKSLVTSFNLDMLCILENRIHLSSLQDPFFESTHTIFNSECSYNNFALSSSVRIWVKWNSNKLHFQPSIITPQLIRV